VLSVDWIGYGKNGGIGCPSKIDQQENAEVHPASRHWYVRHIYLCKSSALRTVCLVSSDSEPLELSSPV
jgi:hypothetical protein